MTRPHVALPFQASDGGPRLGRHQDALPGASGQSLRAVRSAWRRSGCRLAGVALLAGCLGGCLGGSARPPAVYQDEAFSANSVYSREFPAGVRATCEAARRALLSQGYVLKESRGDQINGTKRFQPKNSTYTEIEFSVVCTPSSSDGQHSIAFANAFQGYYAMKKQTQNASVGVAVLGSLSVPVSSTDDALVRVGGETIPSSEFYERFFSLTQHYLSSIPEN